MANYHSLKNASIIEPTSTPDLGSDTNRYGNVYMSGDINMSGTTLTSTNAITPRISSLTYIGNNTAASISGGETLILGGQAFNYGASIYIAGSIVSVVSVVSATQITFISPVKSSGNYALVVVNPDGATATFVPGIQYSGVPAWTTSAGSLGAVDQSTVFSSTLEATSDSAVTYNIISGVLPVGIALNTSTGVLSGTMPSVAESTTYNFTVRASDAENQDTDRNFSVNVAPTALPGQIAYTSPGTYSWTVPAGVTTVSAVLVGTGGGASGQPNGPAVKSGSGGGLRYINALPVIPGETLSVTVGAFGAIPYNAGYTGGIGGDSLISRNANTLVFAGGGRMGGVGGTGSTVGAGPYGGTIAGGNGGAGSAGGNVGLGGGGAGGYSGNGGIGSTGEHSPGSAGAGGGGGGGGGSANNGTGAEGGGVGILGEGTSGGGGASAGSYAHGASGMGGSGGENGVSGWAARPGAKYGGGQGGKMTWQADNGGSGAVRIIWGTGRSFPSTLTTDQ